MSSDSEENNMEMPQFRLIWSPYAELTEDDLMDRDLQDTLTQLDRPNEQDLTENPNPTNQVQEESHSENLENASVNPHFDAQYMDMTEHDIEQFIEGQQNKNTLTKTVRDIALLNKFLKAKNENRELQTIPPVELDPLLANYLLTLRKKDGGEYEPSTLRSIVSSIDRKLKRHKYGHSIAGSTTHQDEAFRLTRESLKAKQKVLKQKGKGNKPLRSQPITDDEINILYERNVLGDSCPDALLRTIWLNNCVHFGLRGVQEHYTLRWGDVTLNTSTHGSQYLELNERQTKTRTGENISDVREISPKIYQSQGDRNPLDFYTLYAAKRPIGFSTPESPFYLATRTIPLEDKRSDIWFLRQKLGERKLGSMVKTMKERGDLDKNKRLTNHSARKYLVQKLRENNIQGTDIMQISGHKNVASVNNYSTISEKQQRNISNILSNTTTDENMVVVPYTPQTEQSNLPRRTSTVTGPVATSTISAPAVCQSDHDNLSTSFCSQTNMSNQIQSMFYGATLHVGTLNVYTHPHSEKPAQ